MYRDGGSESLSGFGRVIDGITDFGGITDFQDDDLEGIIDQKRCFQALTPPFAALIVKPHNEEVIHKALLPEALSPPFLARSAERKSYARLRQVPILIFAWRGSTTMGDWLTDFACSPSLCRPPPSCCSTGPNPGLTLGLTCAWRPTLWI